MIDQPDIETNIECLINDEETVIVYNGKTFVHISQNGDHPRLF